MACIRKRCSSCHARYPLAVKACPRCATTPHTFLLDYRDRLGERRVPAFDTLDAAKDAQAEVRLSNRGPRRRAALDPKVSLEALATDWRPRAAPYLKQNAITAYDYCLARVASTAPVLWRRRVRDIGPDDLADLVGALLADGLSRKSVSNVIGALHTIFEDAIDRGVIATNPAVRRGRSLARKLATPPAEAADRIRQRVLLWPPYSATDELARFLDTAEAYEGGRYHALFFTYSRTGMRRGEALGLQWGDINFAGRTIRVYRSITNDRRQETPKSGLARVADMGDELQAVLLAHRAGEEARWAAVRKPLPPWVFANELGTFLDPSHVQKRCYRLCHLAGLARHTVQDLRHSFATRLLANGASLKYVQEQLGHADIRLTAHRYGSWQPARNPAAQDAFRPVGSIGGITTGLETPKSLSARRDSNPLPTGSKLPGRCSTTTTGSGEDDGGPQVT